MSDPRPRPPRQRTEVPHLLPDRGNGQCRARQRATHLLLSASLVHRLRAASPLNPLEYSGSARGLDGRGPGAELAIVALAAYLLLARNTPQG